MVGGFTYSKATTIASAFPLKKSSWFHGFLYTFYEQLKGNYGQIYSFDFLGSTYIYICICNFYFTTKCTDKMLMPGGQYWDL